MNADLKLYVGATEYGTISNPISFPGVVAGVNTPYANNPIYLWNDKGGGIGSVPAKNIIISVLEMWIENEILGVSSGAADQTFNMAFYPVLDTGVPEDIELRVGDTVWDKVGSLAGQSPTAEVYTLDTATGLITFGNGVTGKIPPISEGIVSNGDFELWSSGPSSPPDNWWEYGAGIAIAQDTGRTGYAAKVSRNGADCAIYQDVTAVKGLTTWKGKTVTFGCWVLANDVNVGQISIYDGVDESKSSFHTGSGSWEWLEITHTVNQSATVVQFVCYVLNADTGVLFDDATDVNEIKITYMPDLLVYGKEVYDSLWLEVKSLGVTANTVTVVDERLTSTDANHVTVINTTVTGVTGVWLQSDPSHVGTNYYTGGSFDANTGIVTLGTPLPSATEQLLVNYTYLPIDDLESVYTPIGLDPALGIDTTHTFVNQIPKNNAKLLYFQLNVPATATPSGSNINFRIQLTYTQ